MTTGRGLVRPATRGAAAYPILVIAPSHCEVGEYAAFLERLPMDASFRRKRLLYRGEFIERWPDLNAWSAEPLAVRIGRLAGERQARPSFPTSYRARGYLFYLAFTDRLRLDYDFLFAVSNMRASETLRPLGIDLGIEQLAAEGARLGYKRLSIATNLRWVLSRLAMHTGVRRPESLTMQHITELIGAARRFCERDDLDLFGRPAKDFTYPYARIWIVNARELQLLLHHRGGPIEAPRLIPSKRRPMPSLLPRMQVVADRWLAVKQSSLAVGTVDHLTVSLRRFVEHLAAAAPGIESFAELTSDHMTSFIEVMAAEVRPKTGRPLSITAQRARVGAVAQFLADGAAWDWPGFPTRPLLNVRDMPRLPRHVPRFIPADELARLMVPIRVLPCPFQRAALLAIRWSGARRDEVVRLTLDCLDAYPDGTARLRIPAGKTMRERMVPLHQEAADALAVVISLRSGGPERPVADRRTGEAVHLVFFRRGKPISADYLFQYPLKALCKALGLVDGSGRPTITAHRFRHTVGTQLAERGASLHTIMSVLGHQSPAMAMVYARISDAEVLRDYKSVLLPGALIAGPGADAVRAGRLSATAVHWLQSNFIKTELELGHCLRLPSEGPCECDLFFTCARFVTTPAYAPRLRERHALELTLAEDAAARDWPREVERHRCIAARIAGLLDELGPGVAGA